MMKTEAMGRNKNGERRGEGEQLQVRKRGKKEGNRKRGNEREEDAEE